jgi:hypothetical protein
MKQLFIVLTLFVVISMTPAWAQANVACSTQTIRGMYGVVCTGQMSLAPKAPQVPMSLNGTVKGDPQGNFTGTGKASLGGAIVDQTVTGVAVVNSDCTGSITYTQKINGAPAPDLNIVFHILDDGKEIRGMSVDAGANLTCSLKLISK